MTSYDSIIIGGGHNGLVCAAYLSKNKKKVLLIEQKEILGGLAKYSDFTKSFSKKVIKDLNLKSYGLKILENNEDIVAMNLTGEHTVLNFKNDTHLKLKRLHDNKVIEFITLKDPIVRVLKLLKGEIDLIQGNLPPEVIAWLDQKESIHIEKKRGNTFTYLGFNMEDPITGNILIRNAIAHAIDRESIIKYEMGSSARLAGSLLPPEHWAGHPNLTGFDYNPEKARMLLNQAGYHDSSPLRLIYKISTDPFRLRLATIIQDQLASVGIEVEIRSYDWGTFYGDIKEGRFQMYSLSWVGLKIPDIFHYIFHSKAIPPHGANRGRFVDSNVDSILELAESEVSLDKQAVYYKELQEYLLKALPYIPLWYEDNILISKFNVKNYTLSADGNFDSLEYVIKN